MIFDFKKFFFSLIAQKYAWLRAALLISLILSCVLFLFSDSDLYRYFQANSVKTLEFQARNFLGYSPKINSKLKIFGLDDEAFSRLGRPEIYLEEWLSIIELIAQQNPKAILIDKVFYNTPRKNHQSLPEFGEKSTRTKVYTAGFFQSEALKYRPLQDLSKSPYLLKSVLNPKMKPQELSAAFTKNNSAYFYGHEPSLENLVTAVGHIHYENNQITPLILTAKKQIVRHLFTYAADTFNVDKDKLQIDDKNIPMYRHGHLVPNFPSLASLGEHTYSMNYLLDHLNEKTVPDFIQKGDVVLLIPYLYTGNTDMRGSPIGQIPGGYVHAALINSLLNNDWINYQEGNFLIIVIFIALGILINFVKNPFAITLTIFIGNFLLFFAGIASFSLYSTEVPWLLSSLSFSSQALITFIFKSWFDYKRHTFIRDALEGSVSEEELLAILKNPEKADFTPHERIVTVMFIDIVNFSPAAEKYEPEVVFNELKEIIKELSAAIHEHHGTIDRTLGDGLLCYFGGPFHSKSFNNHADQALQCSIVLQRQNNERMTNHHNKEFAHSLRIGINTTLCFMGDLGSGQRSDFTIVGAGVNLAKRLESACAPNMILISPSTLESLTGNYQNTKFKNKMIPIKHHTEEILVYEVDPFEDSRFINETRLHQNYYHPSQNTSSQIDLVDTETEFYLDDILAKLINIGQNEFTLIYSLDVFEEQQLVLRIKTSSPQKKQKLLQSGGDAILVNVLFADKKSDDVVYVTVRPHSLTSSQMKLLTKNLSRWHRQNNRILRRFVS
ncbi:MAG: CHASE2 domain-containing protein [Oligoflexales bacterium]|nr:CHASE2 domain-containing protein [Oligoflexales bacterium]